MASGAYESAEGRDGDDPSDGGQEVSPPSGMTCRICGANECIIALPIPPTGLIQPVCVACALICERQRVDELAQRTSVQRELDRNERAHLARVHTALLWILIGGLLMGGGLAAYRSISLGVMLLGAIFVLAGVFWRVLAR